MSFYFSLSPFSFFLIYIIFFFPDHSKFKILHLTHFRRKPYLFCIYSYYLYIYSFISPPLLPIGLDGSLVFLEHVFWVISLNSLFILVFAFCPYHIGHFTVSGCKVKNIIKGVNFEVNFRGKKQCF